MNSSRRHSARRYLFPCWFAGCALPRAADASLQLVRTRRAVYRFSWLSNSPRSENVANPWLRILCPLVRLIVNMCQELWGVTRFWPTGGFSRAVARSWDGAGTRIRTRDLLITNQLLYQLSYTGTWYIRGEEFYVLRVASAMILNRASVLHRFRRRFPVPADQPGPLYRP